MDQHTKRSSDDWHAALDAWRRSGTSQRGFCQAEGISYSAFAYWLRKTKGSNSGSLVRIGTTSPKSAPTLCPRSSIVVTAGSIRLELSGDESEATIAKLFRALGVASCSSI